MQAEEKPAEEAKPAEKPKGEARAEGKPVEEASLGLNACLGRPAESVTRERNGELRVSH